MNVTPAHEQVLMIGRVGEILCVDPAAPGTRTAPPVSVAHLTAPRALHFVHSARAVYWIDADTDEVTQDTLASPTILFI